MTDLIRAPWTPEQVDALNRYQRESGMHPFTCGNPHTGGHKTLVAEQDGWHCPVRVCGWTQDWAHAFMADPTAWAKKPTDLTSPAARILAAVETAMGDTLIPSARAVALDSIQRILAERAGSTTSVTEAMTDPVMRLVAGSGASHDGADSHDEAQSGPPDGLRYRYLEQISAVVEQCRTLTPVALADAVLTVRDAELERLRARAEQAEAAVQRVRAECDRIDAAVRANPTNPDFDGAYLAAVRHIRAALDQTTGAPAPPPPGSTREQLPDHLLALIQPHLPNYLSTACSTSQLLNCDLDQPHASERNTWADRMHQRCRLNMKFTGQLCCCDCHQAQAEG